MDSLINFPIEFLLQIFSYLNPKDLKSLLLTCQRFNIIISSNSNFMSKFELYLTEKRSCKHFRANRKYPNVLLNCCEGFLHIFDQIGATVRKIDIDCREININSLTKILLMCPQVEEITLRPFETLHGTSDTISFQLPQLNLKILRHRCKISLLDIFIHSKVEELQVFGYEEVTHSLRQFLIAQGSLKRLELAHFYKSSLFNDTSMITIDFKLTNLKLVSFHSFNVAIFSMFLMNFEHSLKRLEVNHVSAEIFKTLQYFPTLKTLEIHNLQGSFDGKMPFVKQVTVGRACKDLLSKFPNAEEIEITKSFSKAQKIEE